MRVQRLLLTFHVAASLLFAPQAARAFSDWPSRAVKMIVPFPAGSANDVAARAYAEGLFRHWARPVSVENRPDTAAIAWDDHTLLYSTAARSTVDPLLRETTSFDPVLDLVPIAPAASAILVVAVTDSLPVQSLKDLIELARARPGKLSWSAGPGVSHLVIAATLKRHQLDMIYVPYRDVATTDAGLSKGYLHVLLSSLEAVSQPFNNGHARLLAVTSPQREPMMAHVQTVAEAGFPEMEIEAPAGLFGHRDMPPEIRDRIARDMGKLARDPVIQMRLAPSGQRALAGTPAEFAAAIGRQRIRIQQILHIVDLKSALK